jgi:3',5'-cyclic AMP phosphodiesterase CpdA
MTIWAQITDLHIDNNIPELAHIDSRANALAALEAVCREKIDRLILSGDVSETEAGMTWFLDQVRQRKIVYEFIPGNHDALEALTGENGTSTHFFARQVEEGFLVLFMDSGPYWVDEKQLAWLEAQLAQAQAEVIVFIHHPVLDCGNSLMDQRFPLKNREAVVQILDKADRPIALFCGHYHLEEIVRHKKITQYVTPSTFYQIEKYTAGIEIASEAIGYRLLSFKPGAYETVVKYLVAEHTKNT